MGDNAKGRGYPLGPKDQCGRSETRLAGNGKDKQSLGMGPKKRKLKVPVSDNDSKKKRQATTDSDSKMCTKTDECSTKLPTFDRCPCFAVMRGASLSSILTSLPWDCPMMTETAGESQTAADQIQKKPQPLTDEERKRRHYEKNQRDNRMHTCCMKVWFEGKECVDCHTTDVRLFENDHIDPENKLMKQNGKGMISCMWKVPLHKKGKEVRKCDVLCTRCHRVRTEGRWDPS